MRARVCVCVMMSVCLFCVFTPSQAPTLTRMLHAHTRTQQNIAPLMSSVFRMGKDIRNFSVLLIVSSCAFASAFILMWSGQLEWDTVQTVLLSGISGEIDLDDVYTAGLGAFEYNLSLVLIWAYFALVMIVLMNMLIAMMGETYSQVADNSQKEYRFLFCKTALKYDQSDALLNPPFNLLLIPFFLWNFFSAVGARCMLRCGFKRGAAAQGAKEFCSYCLGTSFGSAESACRVMCNLPSIEATVLSADPKTIRHESLRRMRALELELQRRFAQGHKQVRRARVGARDRGWVRGDGGCDVMGAGMNVLFPLFCRDCWVLFFGIFAALSAGRRLPQPVA
jgi:hypothetical protein